MKLPDNNFLLPADAKKKVSEVFVNIVDSDCEITTAYLQNQRCSEPSRPNEKMSQLKTKLKRRQDSPEEYLDSPTKKCKNGQAIISRDSFMLTEQTASEDNDSEVYFFDLTGSNQATFSPRVELNGHARRRKCDFKSDSPESVSENSFRDMSRIKEKHRKKSISNEIMDELEQTAEEVTIHHKKKHKIKSEKKDVSGLIRYLLDYEGTVEILDSANESSGYANSEESSSCNEKKKGSSIQKEEVSFTEQSEKNHKHPTKPSEVNQINLESDDGTKTKNYLDINDLVDTIQQVEYKNGEKKEKMETGTICSHIIPDSPNRSIIREKKITDDKCESNTVTDSVSQLLASTNFVNAMESLTKHIDQNGLDCFMEGNTPKCIYSSTLINDDKMENEIKTSPGEQDIRIIGQVKENYKNRTIPSDSSDVKNGTEDENDLDINGISHTVLNAEGSNKGRIGRKNHFTLLETHESEGNFSDGNDTLRHLNILLPFEITPLHAISTKTYRFTKQELKKISSLKIPIKQGRFTMAEDNLIRSNWKRLQEEHNLRDIPPSAFFKFPKGMKLQNKLNFLKYIAHGLNDRPLHSVHQRFRLIFTKKASKERSSIRRFAEQEDDYILKTVEKYGPHNYGVFIKIGKTLGRCNKVVARRYQLLSSSEENRKMIHWNNKMCSKLVRKLLKITKLDNVEQLSDFEVPNEVFQKLSKKMNISSKKIKKEYLERIHPHLFADEHLTGDQLKKIIIKKVYKSGVEDIRLVDWKDIAKHCHGVNAVAIAAIFHKLVRSHIPNEQESFKEKVAFLYTHMRSMNQRSYLIKTWTYENGRIEERKDFENSKNSSGNEN